MESLPSSTGSKPVLALVPLGTFTGPSQQRISLSLHVSPVCPWPPARVWLPEVGSAFCSVVTLAVPGRVLLYSPRAQDGGFGMGLAEDW